MKIIGHRGCAGLEPENTLRAIKKAFDLGVNAVEFDVRVTKDRRLILCHDADLKLTSNIDKNIRDLTLEEIRNIKTSSGEPMPELYEALELLDHKTVFIEPKDADIYQELIGVVKNYQNVDIRFTSREHNLLNEIKQNHPTYKIYPTNDWVWHSVNRQVHKLKASGISINYSLMNPLTYWLVKKQKIEIILFTVDEPNQLEKANKLFSDVWLCTNRPDIALSLKK